MINVEQIVRQKLGILYELIVQATSPKNRSRKIVLFKFSICRRTVTQLVTDQTDFQNTSYDRLLGTGYDMYGAGLNIYTLQVQLVR